MLVHENPYMAKTDADGDFEIKNLPAEKLEFQFWHERPNYLRNITMGAHTTNEKGRLELTLDDGVTDLGVVKLSPALFEPKAKDDD